MNKVKKEGAGGKGEIWDWGQFVLSLESQDSGTFAELFSSPPSLPGKP